jgi:hypothetical protein
MIYKEVIGDELYVWMNGSLLYKRWLKYGYGMIFCPIFKTFKNTGKITVKQIKDDKRK